MLSLYEILKASKTGIAPDMWTALAGKNWGGADSGHEVKELTGIPPLTFRADGTPLLDFLISGNMEQSGTPTPQNPIQPQECGDLTGNLFDKTSTHTPSSNTELYTITGLTPNQSYTCSTNFVADPTKSEASIYFGGGSSVTNGVSSNSPKTMMANSNGEISLYIRTTQNPSSNVAIFNDVIAGTIWVMVNAGTAPIPYGYKIPISSANTTTPIYLGEVESTRRIKKLVLTGSEESWIGHGSIPSWYQLTIDDVIIDNLELCTHYKPSPFSPSTIQNGEILVVKNSVSNSGRIIIRDTNYTVKADFLAYLAAQYAAGTPVTVWYVLATPETAVVNEPLRKIGDYADTLSYEQAGVQIPTNRGNTVIDVLTELKPSQMYIKYQE